MGNITVAVVDDQEIDRYTTKRQLAKASGFGPVLEYGSGEDLLDRVFDGHDSDAIENLPLVVLMDVNMLRLSGFETVEALQARMNEGRGPKSIAVMMLTSSDNPVDRAKADALHSVKGYNLKPLDDDGVRTIQLIHQHSKQSGRRA